MLRVQRLHKHLVKQRAVAAAGNLLSVLGIFTFVLKGFGVVFKGFVVVGGVLG